MNITSYIYSRWTKTERKKKFFILFHLCNVVQDKQFKWGPLNIHKSRIKTHKDIILQRKICVFCVCKHFFRTQVLFKGCHRQERVSFPFSRTWINMEKYGMKDELFPHFLKALTKIASIFIYLFKYISNVQPQKYKKKERKMNNGWICKVTKNKLSSLNDFYHLLFCVCFTHIFFFCCITCNENYLTEEKNIYKRKKETVTR